MRGRAMRFVIGGAGAIGGVLGGQLAKAGFAVIFIDKISEHVAAIARRWPWRVSSPASTPYSNYGNVYRSNRPPCMA